MAQLHLNYICDSIELQIYYMIFNVKIQWYISNGFLEHLSVIHLFYFPLPSSRENMCHLYFCACVAPPIQYVLL